MKLRMVVTAEVEYTYEVEVPDDIAEPEVWAEEKLWAEKIDSPQEGVEYIESVDVQWTSIDFMEVVEEYYSD